jgi:hypothetical protein
MDSNARLIDGEHAVTALPRHLAPWANELAIFPPDIAHSLGGWIMRLDSLVGDAAYMQASAGDPDGYDGFERTGPYERLLPSEWLLLLEAPDEFIRRAVYREHGFFRRVYKGAGVQKQTLVLFDRSSEQLGAARLAHLALVIVLMRRSAARSGSFAWGCVQDTHTVQHTSLGRDAALQILRAPCTPDVTTMHIQAWCGAATTSELWFVGSEKLEDIATASAQIVISDVFEPGPRQVTVALRLPQLASPRVATLDLPPDSLCVRLLRNPFETPTSLHPTIASTQPDLNVAPLIAAGGRRVYLRSANALFTYRFANPLGAQPAADVYPIPKGHTLLAVGHSPKHRKKGTVVVTRVGSELCIQRLSKRGRAIVQEERVRVTEQDLARLAVDEAVMQPLAVFNEEHMAFISAGGDLVELNAGTLTIQPQAATCSNASVHALEWLSVQACSEKFDLPTTVTIRRATVSGKARACEIVDVMVATEMPSFEPSQRFFAGSHVYAWFAYESSPRNWELRHRAEKLQVELPQDYAAIGLTSRDTKPVLLALDPARTGLWMVFEAGKQELILTARNPIRHVFLGQYQELGFVTEAGDIGLYSPARKNLVMDVQGGGNGA